MAPGDPSSGRAGRAAQSSLVPRVRPGPTPGLNARNSCMAGGNPAPSADGDTRPFSAERGKQEKVEPGQRARHRYSPCRELYPRRTKRSDRLTVSRNTARPRHASLTVHVRHEQDASGLGDGAQGLSPRSPASSISARLSKTQSLERGTAKERRTPLTVTQERGRRATGTLARKTLSLPAPKPRGWKGAGRCWSTRVSGILRKAAALDRLPKPCRSNLQQKQACLGLHNTGDMAASAAGLWSSAPFSPAKPQPL